MSLTLGISACGSVVDVPSKNYNSRVDYVVIHATSENFAESLRLLTQPSANPVSAHYLVPAPGDGSYRALQLNPYRLVPELERAWHAGVSYWGKEYGLNDDSIGIEVVNEFDCKGTSHPMAATNPADIQCEFPEYPPEQIELLIELLSDILARYPDIEPIDIVGHSDIAILRKSDPGPQFPWQRLYEAGIGAWYEKDTKAKYMAQFSHHVPPMEEIQKALYALGYELRITGEYDRPTQFVMRALQMHYRPSNYSGQMDVESLAILYALLEKYRGDELMELINSREALLNANQLAK